MFHILLLSCLYYYMSIYVHTYYMNDLILLMIFLLFTPYYFLHYDDPPYLHMIYIAFADAYAAMSTMLILML